MTIVKKADLQAYRSSDKGRALLALKRKTQRQASLSAQRRATLNISAGSGASAKEPALKPAIKPSKLQEG